MGPFSRMGSAVTRAICAAWEREFLLVVGEMPAGQFHTQLMGHRIVTEFCESIKRSLRIIRVEKRQVIGDQKSDTWLGGRLIQLIQDVD